MRNELIELLATGEYEYTVATAPLVHTNTKGLWRGAEVITIDSRETIHGNTVKVSFEWLQIGATRRVVAEEITVSAHGRTNKVENALFWDELRKHI